MDREMLTQLLFCGESATLEFKRELYKINSDDDKSKRRERDELIKDILALANGNAYTAGESGYLVVGAEDKFEVGSSRKLYDVSDAMPTADDLLQIVNAACEPRIRSLTCQPFEIEGSRLFVIVVPFSPYLHETTRKLNTPGGTYSEHVVFIRQESSIRLASAREREVIQRVKRIRAEDKRTASPMWVGAGVGSIIGGPVTARVAEMQNRDPQIGWWVGTIFFGILGGFFGQTYRNLVQIQVDWGRLNLLQKTITVLLGAVTGLAVIVFNRPSSKKQ